MVLHCQKKFNIRMIHEKHILKKQPMIPFFKTNLLRAKSAFFDMDARFFDINGQFFRRRVHKIVCVFA